MTALTAVHVRDGVGAPDDNDRRAILIYDIVGDFDSERVIHTNETWLPDGPLPWTWAFPDADEAAKAAARIRELGFTVESEEIEWVTDPV